MISKIKDVYKKYELGLYGSVAGSFIMGTLHLMTMCISFSWLTLNYMLFCYLMMFARIAIGYLDKKKSQRSSYLVTAIFLAATLVPLSVSLARTIVDKEISPFVFDWFIYAYAAYAFVKLGVGIAHLFQSRNNAESKNILCWFSLINALFTMFMLEFNLIKAFSHGTSESMRMIEYFFQGFILLFVLFIIFLFLFRFFSRRKNRPIDS